MTVCIVWIPVDSVSVMTWSDMIMSQHKCLQNEAKSGKYHAFRDLDEWWEAVHLLYVIFMHNTNKIFLTRSDQKSSSAPLTNISQ